MQINVPSTVRCIWWVYSTAKGVHAGKGTVNFNARATFDALHQAAQPETTVAKASDAQYKEYIKAVSFHKLFKGNEKNGALGKIKIADAANPSSNAEAVKAELKSDLFTFDFGTCLRWYPAVPSDAAVVPDVGPTVTATAATRVEKGGATAVQSDESIWADERELSRACQEAEAGERKRRRDWERNHRNGQHPCTDALPHRFTPAVPPTPPPMQPLGVAAALSSVGCMPPPADIFSSWLATLDSPPPSPVHLP